MISILIVDDDINKISAIIDSIHKNYKDQVAVKQASNVQEAIEVLQSNHFHLLITDLKMPIRHGEEPDDNGGHLLLSKLYKKNQHINMPIYIVGLTQFKEIKYNFSAVWKVWEFDMGSNDWQQKLNDLIYHISKVDSKIVKEKKETLFVEGSTDKEILTLAFSLFQKEHLEKVSIEAVSFGGGASWVERQLVIWGKTLLWKDKEKTSYLKAIGLFDNDEAGRIAMESLSAHVPSDSTEHKTFNVMKLDRKYAKHLIPIYKKGIKVPITLEEMYAPFCWKHAEIQGWLEKRNLSEAILNEPQSWDRTNDSLKTHLASLGLTEDMELYVNNKIKDDYKTKLVQYINDLEDSLQKEAMLSFDFLLKDILEKFRI